MYRVLLTASALALAGAATAQTTTTPAPAGTAGAPSAQAPAGTPAQTPPAGTARAPTTAAPAATAPQAGTPAAPASTAPNPTVGGAAMDATKPIPVNASAAPNLSTLVTLVKAAGLDTTLSGPGPFTVFAPTNDAFSRLTPETRAALTKPENKATLAKVLSYHVVPGALTLEQLRGQITAGGGRAALKTVEGQTLTLALEGTNAIALTDANGNKAYLETPDVRQSNGIVHVINGVVSPKLG